MDHKCVSLKKSCVRQTPAVISTNIIKSVMCHLSAVTYENSHSHGPILYSLITILVIRPSIKGLKSTGKRGFRGGTHKHTQTQVTDIAT